MTMRVPGARATDTRPVHTTVPGERVEAGGQRRVGRHRLLAFDLDGRPRRRTLGLLVLAHGLLRQDGRQQRAEPAVGQTGELVDEVGRGHRLVPAHQCAASWTMPTTP